MAQVARSSIGRWVLRIAATLLLAAGALALAASAWMAYAKHDRIGRETQTAESLASVEGRWVQVADAALYIQEWGRPCHPTLLLTHGTGAWSGSWFGLPIALAEAGWRVVAVDLPPFGLSLADSNDAVVDYSRAAQARRILGLVDALGGPT